MKLHSSLLTVCGILIATVCCEAQPATRPGKAAAESREPAPVYLQFRGAALTGDLGEAGYDSAGGQVQVVLMEAGIAENVVTVAAFADGTTSMYYSTGGGIIGAGGHDAVRRAAA